MSEENMTLESEDLALNVIDGIKDYFPILQCIGLFIELAFFFMMIRNWCMKTTSLRSAFFYLLTLKTVNDFFYMFYTIGMDYWYDSLRDFYDALGFLFFSFSAGVDTLCQLVIALNRFTALMMTLKHERIWSTTVTSSFLIIIPLLSALLTYGELNLSYISSMTVIAIYDLHRLILIIITLILIFIPVLKHCVSKPTNNTNSVVFANQSMNTSSKKQKAERQLLYETIFICFWKALNICTNTVYMQIEMSFFVDSLLSVIMDASVFISNVGGLIVLFFISSVARKGFKQAFWIEKAGGRSVTTGFTTIRK